MVVMKVVMVVVIFRIMILIGGVDATLTGRFGGGSGFASLVGSSWGLVGRRGRAGWILALLIVCILVSIRPSS